ncbi:hypothetical protein [Hyphomicrobium sp. CS1GBMeth3]|uniref:hypothetical protein n=1 Tax=Hyphomicrobium sp. CS1GBMeth3 TaxID=1892845 RepID=UPI0009F85C16|nr:hypothetical protein [Hyphomicrobium sp. CS1GBMeth3]
MTPIRTILAATAALCATAVATEAGAVSLSVKMACASDYYAHCSQHDPDSPGVRKCMRAVGKNLSSRCINALVAAGEVPKSAIEKKLAAR